MVKLECSGSWRVIGGGIGCSRRIPVDTWREGVHLLDFAADGRPRHAFPFVFDLRILQLIPGFALGTPPVKLTTGITAVIENRAGVRPSICFALQGLVVSSVKEKGKENERSGADECADAGSNDCAKGNGLGRCSNGGLRRFLHGGRSRGFKGAS